MASLYEINEELMACTDMETGEIIDVARFEQLQLDRETKLENIALWHKNLLADAEAYKAEAKSFAEKQKRAEEKAESLKKYLSDSLAGKEFKTVKVAISYRKSTSVNITNEELLPKEYLVEKTVVAADKKAIGDKLKEGEEIAGAELSVNSNIQIK